MAISAKGGRKTHKKKAEKKTRGKKRRTASGRQTHKQMSKQSRGQGGEAVPAAASSQLGVEGEVWVRNESKGHLPAVTAAKAKAKNKKTE